MRILLVRPPVPRQTIGLKHIMICEPLELEYVAAGLCDHDVQIMDMIVEKGFEKRLASFKPDVVGTSCYITGVNEVIKLCRTVKRWNPDCKTVVGGVHAACVPEDFSDSAIDCIVVGDGTSIMPDVVNAFCSGQSLRNLPGLALPTRDGVVRTPGRPYMPAPDSLPFPRRELVSHLKDRYYYLLHQPVATMKTLWGCWYKCNFCFTWHITGGKPFFRSPESIVAELETIEADDVYIVDDIFLIKPSRLGRLARLIRERGIKKNYLVYARADFISQHESIIEEWAELGLKAVFIGLEAATQDELESMEKESTVADNRRAVEVLRRHGVDTYGSLIPQPDYDLQDWERLWQFIDETGLYYVNISPLTPLPGTEIWAKYRTQLTVDRRAHPIFDLTHVVLPTKVPLREYYRSLLNLYMRTCLNIRRANKLAMRTRPPIWSWRYLRMWWGALRIYWQVRTAHQHHSKEGLEEAMDRGPEFVPANATDPKPSEAEGPTIDAAKVS